MVAEKEDTSVGKKKGVHKIEGNPKRKKKVGRVAAAAFSTRPAMLMHNVPWVRMSKTIVGSSNQKRDADTTPRRARSGCRRLGASQSRTVRDPSVPCRVCQIKVT